MDYFIFSTKHFLLFQIFPIPPFGVSPRFKEFLYPSPYAHFSEVLSPLYNGNVEETIPGLQQTSRME